MIINAIIQARMSSRRFPGKVLKLLGGKAVIEHVVERTKACGNVNEVIVATSDTPEDDAIENWCTRHNIKLSRGSLDDVLDRFKKTIDLYPCDAILRITADCPAIDPRLINEVVEGFRKGDYDQYGLVGKFPDGLDCCVFSNKAIQIAWQESTLPSEREHVGPFIEKNPKRFKLGGFEAFDNEEMAQYRWTLDEEEDYKLLELLFNELKSSGLFGYNDIIKVLKKRPEWSEINKHIIRNEGYKRSLLEERKIRG